MTFRSQPTRLLPLRAFFPWLAKSNYLLSNPASERELPKLQHYDGHLKASEKEDVTVFGWVGSVVLSIRNRKECTPRLTRRCRSRA